MSLLVTVLFVYCIVIARLGSVNKNIKKWAYFAAVLTAGLSVFIFMDISFNGFTEFLNGTVGDFTRRVVKK
ncbi:hypothetical protein [Bacillus sp. FJAT-27225]|uniref:hypothetical protein n=1 Tax=Bacillus sp. FJAT-27225 TaxID=1743144 RepID=UPI0011126604|nr:hypothetical protein [Bacillus sp. FJAT-27225]